MGRTVRSVLFNSQTIEYKRVNRAPHRARRCRFRNALASGEPQDSISELDWRMGTYRPRWLAESRLLRDERTCFTGVRLGTHSGVSYQVVRSKQILRRGRPGAFMGHRNFRLSNDGNSDVLLAAASSIGMDILERVEEDKSARLQSVCHLLAVLRSSPCMDYGVEDNSAHVQSSARQGCSNSNEFHMTKKVSQVLASADIPELVKETLEDFPSVLFHVRSLGTGMTKEQLLGLICQHVTRKTRVDSGSFVRCKGIGAKQNGTKNPVRARQNLDRKATNKKMSHHQKGNQTADGNTYLSHLAKKHLRTKTKHRLSGTVPPPCCVGCAPWLPDVQVRAEVAAVNYSLTCVNSASLPTLPSVSVLHPSGEVFLTSVQFDPSERITQLWRRIHEAHSGGLRCYWLISPAGKIVPAPKQEEEIVCPSVAAFGILAGDVLTVVRRTMAITEIWLGSIRLSLVEGCVVLGVSKACLCGDQHRLRLWSDGSCQMLIKYPHRQISLFTLRNQMRYAREKTRLESMQLLQGFFELHTSGDANYWLQFDWERCIECDLLPVGPLRLNKLQRSSPWIEKKIGFNVRGYEPWSLHLSNTPFPNFSMVNQFDHDLKYEQEEVGKALLLFGFRSAAHGGL